MIFISILVPQKESAKLSITRPFLTYRGGCQIFFKALYIKHVKLKFSAQHALVDALNIWFTRHLFISQIWGEELKLSHIYYIFSSNQAMRTRMFDSPLKMFSFVFQHRYLANFLWTFSILIDVIDWISNKGSNPNLDLTKLLKKN